MIQQIQLWVLVPRKTETLRRKERHSHIPHGIAYDGQAAETARLSIDG